MRTHYRWALALTMVIMATEVAHAQTALKMNISVAQNSHYGVAIDTFAREVEKRTNGRYKIQTFYAGALGAEVSGSDPTGLQASAELMAEFSTAVKYGLPIKVIVFKNNELGMIKWEQLVFLGNPQYGVELEPIDHIKFAEACGGRGFRIVDASRCGAILAEALAAPGPVIVEAVVDPNEPPLPPKITAEQAAHFTEALLRGEPNREKIALTALSDTVRQLV